jgi:hypothetical protein
MQVGFTSLTYEAHTQEGFMDQRALGSTANSLSDAQSSKHHAGRGVWVLTAYGISGLALLGVLAYYFSDFITH